MKRKQKETKKWRKKQTWTKNEAGGRIEGRGKMKNMRKGTHDFFPIPVHASASPLHSPLCSHTRYELPENFSKPSWHTYPTRCWKLYNDMFGAADCEVPDVTTLENGPGGGTGHFRATRGTENVQWWYTRLELERIDGERKRGWGVFFVGGPGTWSRSGERLWRLYMFGWKQGDIKYINTSETD